MAIFNVVYTCRTASDKSVSGLIEMLGFDKGENLFILIFIKPLHYNWPRSIIQQIVAESDSSDTELPSSPAKRKCSTRSGRSATSFAFR